MDISRLFQSVFPKQTLGVDKDPNPFHLKGLVAGRILEMNQNNDALVDFSKFKAFVRIPFKADPGVDIRIQFSDKGTPLQISQESKAAGNRVNPESGKPDRFEIIPKSAFSTALPGQVKTGDRLLGRVTGFTRQGKMFMDFGQFKAFAKIDFPVKAGQVFSLRVSDVARGLQLEIDKGKTADIKPKAVLPQPVEPITLKDLKQIRHIARRVFDTRATSGIDYKLPEPVKLALERIDSFFKPLVLEQKPGEIEAHIRKAVKDSGLYFEKKLEQAILKIPEEKQGQTTDMPERSSRIATIAAKDLKPNLLIIRQSIESGELLQPADDKKNIQELRSTVSKILSHIEFQQAQAVVRQDDAAIYQALTHLLHLPDEARQARLKVYYPKKNKEGREKTPRVSILLDMEKMGAIRTDLWMVQHDLNLTFYVQSEPVKAMLLKESQQITDVLADRFDHIFVNVAINQNKIKQFETEAPETLGSRIVDLKV